ncbi:MAG TPA: hypothetical protein VLJ38_07165 [Polyangiaceae bacterium]|nr:hypothetical protein [Polyangiaceae bacterium]
MGENSSAPRTACPHCKQRAGVRFWYLLPSSNSRRVLTCVHCGGHYDLADGSKMASIFGALLGLGPGVYLLGKIVQFGHNATPYKILGTVACFSLFVVLSMVAGALTLRLVAKP